MNKLIAEISQAALRTDHPAFRAGDSVRVHVRVVEGNRSRIQVFAGVVISRTARGIAPHRMQVDRKGQPVEQRRRDVLVVRESLVDALCERHLAWVETNEDYAAMLARELPSLPQRVQLTLVASRSAIAEAFLAALDRGTTAGTLRLVDGPTAFAFWQGTLDYHLVHRHLFAADGRVIRARGPALIPFFVTALQHDALPPRGSA